MLHTINLAGETGEINESPVAKTFGLTDMYRDFAEASNQHYLEMQLSRLESHAGRIVSKLKKSLEAGEPEVWLSRPERNNLRKFAFIMKYRGSRFHTRFYHQNAEGYSENDREFLLKYMQEKGFKKPIDVWFDNIKAMLELEMDLEDKWMGKLLDRIYPDDAKWFIENTQQRYLAFCTTSDKDDEFLLTENVYGIHEGPTSFNVNPETGERTPTAYTEYHVLSIISPKLVMVLRSLILPVPEEDSDEATKKWRSAMYEASLMQHNEASRSGSTLEDLPISKARNSYTEVIQGKVVWKEGEDGSRRDYHKFCFRFFPISTEYVNKINSLMLEESYHISTIAFKSKLSARRALEHYLSMPCYQEGFTWKLVQTTPDDPKRLCIKKLEQALRKLGSDTAAVYIGQPSAMSAERKAEMLNEMLEKHLPEEPSEFMKLYMKLGGTRKTISKDLDQATKMVNLRIKIDVWSKGTDERIREEIRNHLRDLYCQLPARRVWYYLKNIRCMLLEGKKRNGLRFLMAELPKRSSDLVMNGPEDVIVNANHIVRANDLCRLMFFAASNHIKIIQNPGFDVGAKITFDEAGARRLWRIKELAFGESGSICDCAISAVEERARSCKDVIREMKFYEAYKNPFWTEDENIEMATRVMIEGEFSSLVGKRLPRPDVKSLKKVLFGVVYPTIGCSP